MSEGSIGRGCRWSALSVPPVKMARQHLDLRTARRVLLASAALTVGGTSQTKEAHARSAHPTVGTGRRRHHAQGGGERARIEQAHRRCEESLSLALLGLLGISVAAGEIRGANFPILATGSDARHHTIVLAHVQEPLLRALASVFRREER